MPEAILYTTGKPDTAESPLPGSTHSWKLVSAGDLIVCVRKPDQAAGLVRNALEDT